MHEKLTLVKELLEIFTMVVTLPIGVVRVCQIRTLVTPLDVTKISWRSASKRGLDRLQIAEKFRRLGRFLRDLLLRLRRR